MASAVVVKGAPMASLLKELPAAPSALEKPVASALRLPNTKGAGDDDTVPASSCSGGGGGGEGRGGDERAASGEGVGDGQRELPPRRWEPPTQSLTAGTGSRRREPNRGRGARDGGSAHARCGAGECA